MRKWNILIAESEDYSEEAITMLSEIGNVDKRNINRLDLLNIIHVYEILIIRLANYIDAEVFEKAVKLKYIISATTGTDHIDLVEMRKKGVELICLKGEEEFLSKIPSTAEHTWALVLALIKKIPSAFSDVKKGSWDRQSFRGHNLEGMRLGILGLGRVGKQVANYGLAFGCQVGSFDNKKDAEIDNVKSFEAPQELLKWCDILSIHIPYNSSNHLFLNKELLKFLRKGAYVVNTSRGGIWDEQVICNLLISGYLGGVATDVLTGELNPTGVACNPLVRCAQKVDSLIITPHIAGATFESMARTEIFVVDKLLKQIKKLN